MRCIVYHADMLQLAAERIYSAKEETLCRPEDGMTDFTSC